VSDNSFLPGEGLAQGPGVTSSWYWRWYIWYCWS